MPEAKPISKAIESTLEDICHIPRGCTLEIHIMQTDGSLSKLFGKEGGVYNYVVSIKERGSNRPSNGPLTSAEEVMEVYAYLKEYAQNRGIVVADSPTSYMQHIN